MEQPLEAGKGVEMNSIQTSIKKPSPADTLILVQGDSCRTSDFRNCQIINYI